MVGMLGRGRIDGRMQIILYFLKPLSKKALEMVVQLRENGNWRFTVVSNLFGTKVLYNLVFVYFCKIRHIHKSTSSLCVYLSSTHSYDHS